MNEELRPEDIKLTDKQRKWAESYVKTGNATQACRDAGYEGSESALGKMGYDNLRHPKILAYIASILGKTLDQHKAEYQQASIASIEEVMQFYSEGMRGKIKDQFGLDAMLSDRVKCANSLDKILTMAEKAKQEDKKEAIHIEQYYGREDVDDE